MGQSVQEARSRQLVALGALALAYYLSARLGLQLAVIGKSVTPLWPPTGVAVVALLGFGLELWPAVTVAAFLVNLPISPSAACAAGIAAGNTLAPVVAVWLLRRTGFRRDLLRLRDALTLVAVALVSMTISASIGTASLVLGHAVRQTKLPVTWWAWWTGDAMGVLIVAPFLWSLRLPGGRPLNPRRVMEACAITAVLAGWIALVTAGPEPMLFLALPLVLWAAWRFQQRGAAPAGLAVSVIAIVAAVHNRGNFVHDSLLTKMVTLQLFNAGVSFSAFFFAAAVAERRQAFEDLYEREHRIAETFQRSLLPDRLPEIPGLELSARYIPASRESDVGGDWYDVMPLPRGRVGLVVGDVAGHGLPAAAAMAELRMALRTHASMDTPPAEVLDRLNRLTADLHPELIATLLFAAYDPPTGELRFASAGHPPPLVLTRDGEARFVTGGLGPPVGVSTYSDYEEATFRVDTGGALFLYTDGLVERRDRWLDERLEELRHVAARGVPDLEIACQHMIDSLLSHGVADDVALLAVRPVSLAGQRLRLERPAHPSFVPDVRHLLRRWLADNGATPEEVSDILIAVTEAHGNAVQHAYRRGGGRIELEAAMDGTEVVVTVRDHGSWRAPGSKGDEGGRGLPLIRALMDGMRVQSTAPGTEIRMTRRLRAVTAASPAVEGSGPPAEACSGGGTRGEEAVAVAEESGPAVAGSTAVAPG